MENKTFLQFVFDKTNPTNLFFGVGTIVFWVLAIIGLLTVKIKNYEIDPTSVTITSLLLVGFTILTYTKLRKKYKTIKK